MWKSSFIVILLITCFQAIGQRTIEVTLSDLDRINSEFGIDSLKKIVKGIPIWKLDTVTSISILKSIHPTGRRNSWGHTFAREMGLEVRSKIIDSKLKNFLDEEIKNIKETDFINYPFQSLSDKLLIGLLFQNSADLETIFESHLEDLIIIGDKIESKQPRNRLKYFFKGWPPIVWNKYGINLAQFKILNCLNQLNPTKYPDDLIAEQRKGLHSLKKDYVLKKNIKRECSYEELEGEEIDIHGIKVPKELFDSYDLSDKCWLVKIKRDTDNYIVERGCSFSPLNGRGDTTVVIRRKDRFKLCVLKLWVS